MNKKYFALERLELANRLRQIRENAGYTQEGFAELLGLTLPAYKKIESAENQLTLDRMRILNKKLNVSADFLLYGKNSDFDETWKMIQNCTESQKLCLMIRLMTYFTKVKSSIYMEKKSLQECDNEILEMINFMERE